MDVTTINNYLIYNKFYYINGNYLVINNGGKRTYRGLRVNEEFVPKFPDSIDLKITNNCTFNCPYCHESSSPNGKTMNIERTKQVLSKLPKVGIELAIGGGDALNCLDETKELLNWCKNRFLARLTLNIEDFCINKDKIKELMKNENNFSLTYIGVSINPDMSVDDIFGILQSFFEKIYNYPVFHVIVGVNPIDQILSLYKKFELKYPSDFNLLILGYKNWGRGKTYTPDFSNWSDGIKKLLYNQRVRKNECINIGFDNLALEQLKIKDGLLDSEWNTLYLGDEFTHSLYIDAVKEEYGPTSRDPFRVSWDDMDVLEFFEKYRNKTWEK